VDVSVAGEPVRADDRAAVVPEARSRDDRYTVRSVQRALQLIEIVASEPQSGLSLTEIARILGVSKSTTLATARTLTAHGILRSIEPGPRYKLGTALIRYGELASESNALGELCLPVLRSVSAATGMTARLAVTQDGYPVGVERVDGQGNVRFHAPLGQREPPHATAAGKAILAMLSRERIEEICRETGLARFTEHTITEQATLFAELHAVRRRGYSVDDEEEVMGVFCVGAPVFDHNGDCAGAISVTGIKHDLPSWRIAEIGEVVGAHADEMSRLLGGPAFGEVTPPDISGADGTPRRSSGARSGR
jgi:IclR family transcriptional regulator, acetate operon repressor